MSLAREIDAHDYRAEERLSRGLDRVVNEYLSRVAHKGLAIIASSFEDQLERVRQRSIDGTKIVAGNRMWPLIPSDYISQDGRRIARPLTSYWALRTHGQALSNCLGTSMTNRYLGKGRQGKTFIIGILNRNESPRSTAEIVVSVGKERVGYEFEVRQHTAKRNRGPSLRCKRAIGELLAHCHTPDVRRHIERGWKLIDDSKTMAHRRIRKPADWTVVDAMKATIGHDQYRRILDKARSST
jgi:hypothetical protein